MAASLRASVLAILLVTSLVPLGALAYAEANKLRDTEQAARVAELESAALTAAIRVDAATSGDADTLRAAATGLPSDWSVMLMDRTGAWRAPDGTSGMAPGLVESIGARLSGSIIASDPRSGAPSMLAWARAPAADALVIVTRPPAASGIDLSFFMVAGTIAAGVILAAVVLTARVVKPIARLERATRRVAEEGALHAVPAYEGSREVQALAASFNAMTASLARQRDDLEDYAQNLDRLVRDRTRSLAESRSDVEALVFTIAHELREPMRSMRTTADLVLGDESGEEALHALRLLRDRIAYLERILLDLMRFDEIARAKEALVETDLGALARRALDAERAALPEGALNVTIAPLPRAMIHPDLLLDAFREIFRNVAQHAGPGTVSVRASTQGKDVVITIDDEGKGIPVDRREDAFHLFQRLRADSPGTGAGLAIVRRIVERHDGKVHLEAAPSGGLRVVIRLPIRGPSPRAAPPPATMPSRQF